MPSRTESPLGPIPETWRLGRLGELTTKIGSGATPRGGEEAYLPKRQRYALIRSQNVYDRHFNAAGLAFISDADATRLKGVEVQPGDVLLNITGDGITFSRSCMVAQYVLPACVNQHVAIVRTKSELLDSGYLLAYLTHPRIKHYVESFNAGGSRRAITKGHIESFEIPLPPLKEQRSIAEILRALDDKIDLNSHTNQTLGAIARAMFKSWFVDFDPVRAKMEGRKPAGMSTDIAKLFPSLLETSALGPIPRGWKVSNIGEICEVIDCLHSKKPIQQPSGKLLLQLWNIRDNGLVDSADPFWVSDEDYAGWISRMEAVAGDCVITNVGRVGAVGQIPSGLTAALGRNMTGLRGRKTFPFPTFLIECLLSFAMRREIELKMDSGTILDSLNVRNIPKLRLVHPGDKVLPVFEALTRPLRARMEHNLAESNTLAALRDTLLPKLLSGELRIKDAEKKVEAAT